jgi:hypothetical protein
MIITLDGQPHKMQPDGLNWDPPRLLGVSGEGERIFAPYWTCRLTFSKITRVKMHEWLEAWQDGDEHTVVLPHPKTGTMTSYTCRVTDFRETMDVQSKRVAALAGADVALSNIEIT